MQNKPNIAQKAPYKINVEKGKNYAICSCAYSKTEPFCDGSHKEQDTNLKSTKYYAEESKQVYFCGCKHSKTMPLCDGSHKKL